MSKWSWLTATAVGAAVVVTLVSNNSGRKSPAAAGETPAVAEPRGTSSPTDDTSSVRVQTVKPTRGALERTTVQPGSLHAFEYAALYAKVSGYLNKQVVDIGDKVKRGEVLAEIYAPELEIEVQQAAAALFQAKAEVDQAKARLVTAQAKEQAALATVTQAEADLGRYAAQRAFREKQYVRIKKLFELNSIDERLVDEKQDEMEAARAAERAAQAAIVTAKADVASAAAKVEEARSDIQAATARVQVSQAALDRAKVYAEYLKIVSPYDGVVTNRAFHRGDFLRGAERGGESAMLEVARTDLMRVVVKVPDLDVPWIERGNPATVEIDALPGEVFRGTVARTAEAEDTESRTMRVEIDLANPTGRLRQGMYGRATIKLHPNPNGLLIPSSCLVGPLKKGKSAVYVVRGGKASLTTVEVAADDGVHVEISKGLADVDEVVSNYNGPIGDGVPVTIVNENKS
jgi:RND family efflux transporter MFP subunit